MSTINWISATIGLITAGLIFYLVRRDHLHTRYTLWWIPTAFLLAIFGVFPQLIDKLGLLLGISYPPVIALLLGLMALLIKILLMDIERSRNEVKLIRLIQRMAILEKELDDIKSKNNQ